MTKLNKTIKREVTIPRVNRPVIVELDPETKRIGFHEKGCRRVYWMPIQTAYTLAILQSERDES